nr:ribonuclease H-like domain-containing protein [Tanacetum cinerariifolium]
CPKRNIVPKAVLIKFGIKSVNAARQKNLKAAVTVNTARPVNIAHRKTTMNAVKPRQSTNGLTRKKSDRQWMLKIHDGNMSYLINYEEIDGGYVAFGAERRNRTLIKAAKIMLADSKLPTTFWVEAVNTTCYVQNRPVVAGTQSNGNSGIQDNNNTGQTRKEKEPNKDYILLPLWTSDLPFPSEPKSSQDAGFKPSNDVGKKVNEVPREENECKDQQEKDSVNCTNRVNAVSLTVNAASNEVNVVDRKSSIELPDDPNIPELKDISIFKDSDEDVFGAKADLNNIESTFQAQKNKLDERGIMIRNKARLMAQGHTQEEGIDYDEVFAPVARIEAIMLFLAYASFKDFMVYQIDVKSAFVYGKIKEEEKSNNGSSGYNNIFNMSIMPCGSKYKTARELCAVIIKTFGGNEATKKTKKNLLKQQYGNFKAEGSETLEQTFTRLQVIVGQLQFMDVEIEQDDLNQKFLTSLAPEWLMHNIVWRNRSDLDAMSLDDLYNHLKVYESEVQKKTKPHSQNMAFISSAKHSSRNKDGNTASVPTASTNVPTASASDWSYMADEEEDHALVADEVVHTEFALMANTSAKSKEGVDEKLAGLLIASKDLDNLIESQRSDKNKEGLGYTDVPPPPAQLYLSFKKDLSWTGLPECADDTVTDYSRLSPTVESTSEDDQNRNPSVSENVPSPIIPKPFIKFVKPKYSQSESNTDKKEILKKPPVKYAEQYIKPNKKPNAHSYANTPVHRTSVVRSPYRAPWVPTVNMNYPPVNRKFSTVDAGTISTNLSCTKDAARQEVKKDLSSLRYIALPNWAHDALLEFSSTRTMLADAKLPVTFWAEAVNTACYVQNRVLVNKSQNKTPYELFNGRAPAIGFLKPFGCHVMILNMLDNLGKFQAKGDEGYFIGYSMSNKAFRVFNKRTRRVEENLHVEFLENKVIEQGAGPNWLFDIDSLTKSINYVPVDAGTISTNHSGTKDAANQEVRKNESSLRYILLPN